MTRRRLGAVLGLLVALVLLVPTAVTVARFTSEDTAASTSGGTGQWCAVPTPETQSNVYRLQDMPQYTFGDDTSHMIIVPVVNNGEFGPTGGNGRIGARLWACDSSQLTDDSWVKVTSLRRHGTAEELVWTNRQSEGFAGHRLNPEEGFGAQLSQLHRQGSGDGVVRGYERSEYTWLVSSGRTKEVTDAFPACSDSECQIDLTPHATFAQGFQHDTGTDRAPDNAVEYLGSGYWSGPRTFTPNEVNPVQLVTYTGPQPPFQNQQGPTSTDGRQVQWVVMQWWGSTEPSDDMVIEVFLE